MIASSRTEWAVSSLGVALHGPAMGWVAESWPMTRVRVVPSLIDSAWVPDLALSPVSWPRSS
jgi:hypothetical protein